MPTGSAFQRHFIYIEYTSVIRPYYTLNLSALDSRDRALTDHMSFFTLSATTRKKLCSAEKEREKQTKKKNRGEKG